MKSRGLAVVALMILGVVCSAEAQSANKLTFSDPTGFLVGKPKLAKYTIDSTNGIMWTISLAPTVYGKEAVKFGAQYLPAFASMFPDKTTENDPNFSVALLFPGAVGPVKVTWAEPTDPRMVVVSWCCTGGLTPPVTGTSGSFEITKLTITPDATANNGKRVSQLIASFDVHYKTPTPWSVSGTIEYDEKLAGGPGGSPGSPSPTPTPTPTPVPTSKNISLALPSKISSSQLMTDSQSSLSVPVSLYALAGFEDDVAISASVDAEEESGVNVSVVPSSVHVPSNEQLMVKFETKPLAFPREYHVTVSATTASDRATYSTTFPVTLYCDVPMILGLDQPKNVTVKQGQDANLKVTAVGTSPLFYQWYAGHAGNSTHPVPNATADTLKVSGLSYGSSEYWVRITNACGTVDSNTATVSVAPSTAPTRRR